MKTVSPGRSATNDDSRKLLKIFGVAVTDSEAEAEKPVARAGQLSTHSTREEIAAPLKDGADLCRESNTRLLEITERVFAVQSRLQTQLAEAAAKLQDVQ
jgi:ribosomal protein L16 Arg81 hydroxylase